MRNLSPEPDFSIRQHNIGDASTKIELKVPLEGGDCYAIMVKFIPANTDQLALAFEEIAAQVRAGEKMLQRGPRG